MLVGTEQVRLLKNEALTAYRQHIAYGLRNSTETKQTWVWNVSSYVCSCFDGVNSVSFMHL
mgnify:CR=1 FL=1